MRAENQAGKNLDGDDAATEADGVARPRQSGIQTPDRFQQLTAGFRQRKPQATFGALLQREQPPLDQRVEFSSIHIDLVRRMADQHQRGNFVRTQQRVVFQ